MKYERCENEDRHEDGANVHVVYQWALICSMFVVDWKLRNML